MYENLSINWHIEVPYFFVLLLIAAILNWGCKKGLLCTNNKPPQRGGAAPSLHWGGSKWVVNSPRVSSLADSPLDNSSHFLSLLSNARSHVDSTLKPN